jgi:diacylglycerol kinase
MAIDNHKNKVYVPHNFFSSLRIAINGLMLIIKNERNFRIQLVVATFIGILGLFLDFSHLDWVAIGLLVTLVLISEAFNSVVEALSDTISQEYRVNIKYAKDVSAGAVLISATASVIAGGLIILPYVVNYLRVLGIIS